MRRMKSGAHAQGGELVVIDARNLDKTGKKINDFSH